MLRFNGGRLKITSENLKVTLEIKLTFKSRQEIGTRQLPLQQKVPNTVAINLKVLQHTNTSIEKVHFHADGRVKLEHLSERNRSWNFSQRCISFGREDYFVDFLRAENEEKRGIGGWRCGMRYV